MEKGVPIRVVSRAMAILQAVNRRHPITLMEIAREAGVPHSTARRIVETLVVEGLIERDELSKHIRPTALVQTLSVGFQADERLVTASRRHIVNLTRSISWPVAVVSRVGQMMMVRDSTHALSSMTFNPSYPGYTLPVLESASGRVYLAFCSDVERHGVIEGMKLFSEPQPGAHLLPQFDDGPMLEEIRRQGFATKNRNPYTANPGKTSSIAVPVFQQGELAGSIVVVFLATALGMARAVETLLPPLQRAAAEISAQLSPGRQAA